MFIKITITEKNKKPDKYFFTGKHALKHAENLITKKYRGKLHES